jgi:polysaccharide export outer membrane protein
VSVTVNVTNFSGHRYYVIGEVRNPGYFELNKPTTVLDAVAIAGGATKRASLNHVQIVRGDPNNPEIIRVKLKDIEFKGDDRTNYQLQNQDVVIVPPNAFARTGYFFRKILFPFSDIIALVLSALGTLYIVHR